jgi:hypothetical protein
MTTAAQAYQKNGLRVLENQGQTFTPPHIVPGQPKPCWLQGDIIELARLTIPRDLDARLVRFEYSFIDLDYAYTLYETSKSTIIGRLLPTDLKFFFLLNYSGILPASPWVANVGSAPDSLAGLPGVPFTSIEGVNAYKFSAGDNRELPFPIPLPSGVTCFLVARFYQDIIHNNPPATLRFAQYQNASLAGRIMIEVSQADSPFTTARMMMGPR